ncbi:MAG: nitroreductase family protein [Treponema sp.]|nr:nitroreductase family protein [Treponema sp.]
MKKSIFILGMILLTVSFASAQNNTAINTIIHHYAARDYLPGAVSQSDLDQIIRAAVNTPSASNRQPWHFTIVQNFDLAKRIVPNVTEGNVLFVISAAGDSQTNITQIIDCSLAAQTVYMAAQALGLGSRIYTGPVSAVNRDIKASLGLPNGHSVVIIVRIGRVQPVDAVSAASARNPPDRMVTYKK